MLDELGYLALPDGAAELVFQGLSECHEEGCPRWQSPAVTDGADQGGPWNIMLHIGLDLSRKRLDYDLLCEDGSRIERGAVPPDADGLRGLVDHVNVYGEPISAAIESMNGARFVHDELERWAGRSRSPTRRRSRGLRR